MRRHRTLIVCCAIALLVIGAIAVQGVPVFSGIRWVPNLGRQAPPAPQFTDQRSTTPAPKAHDHLVQVDISWIVILGAVIVMTVVALLLWRAMRNRRQEPREVETATLGPLDNSELEPEPEPEAHQVRRGLDLALDILTEPREPRDAIEQAWLGLQDAADESGIRRLPAETPGEFTARVLSRVGADPEAAHMLLGLYVRVRFGDAPVTANDVETARRSLEALRASWTTDIAGGVA